MEFPRRAVSLVKGRLISLRKRRLDLDLERRRLLDYLRDEFAVDADSLLGTYETGSFRADYLDRQEQLRRDGLLSEDALTSDFDCVTMYLIVRAARPATVVETGAFQGGFTAHILQAMEENELGKLWSIDLPKKGRFENQEGALVAERLRPRWTLELGDARELLPALMARAGTVDLFHHDSLHTFRHMLMEFDIAYPHIAPNGLITSHDVMSPPGIPNGFHYFCRRRSLAFEVFRNFGVARVSRS